MIFLRTNSDELKTIAKALGAEADGKRLKRDLGKGLRKALQPAVAEARKSIRSMPSKGGLGKDSGPGLRQAIARRIRAEARLSGRSVGARVKAKKTGMPRGFENAPKRTNRAAGWRHPGPPKLLPKGVMGPTEPPEWYHQVGKPGWFDDPMRNNRAAYRAAVRKAMADAARRITRG